MDKSIGPELDVPISGYVPGNLSHDEHVRVNQKPHPNPTESLCRLWLGQVFGNLTYDSICLGAVKRPGFTISSKYSQRMTKRFLPISSDRFDHAVKGAENQSRGIGLAEEPHF